MPARSDHPVGDPDALTPLDPKATEVLGGTAERAALLNALGECRETLAKALAGLPGADGRTAPCNGEALAHYVAQLREEHGPNGARLGAVARRYEELRSKLALANMRLVAHIAKRFRDRGIAYSDLLQEGFCGLLEAIDRFDLGRETKLATYATWWIRQSMQRAVAAGAYPVRLSPRHLRQLAQNQGDLEGAGAAAKPGEAPGAGSSDMIRKIHAATRPSVSFDSALDGDSDFRLSQTMGDPDPDPSPDLDADEAIGRLIGLLRPREQEVLEYRYGLSGRPRLSLSQVGRVMAVSKERVRQIQDRALEKLRIAAQEEQLEASLFA